MPGLPRRTDPPSASAARRGRGRCLSAVLVVALALTAAAPSAPEASRHHAGPRAYRCVPRHARILRRTPDVVISAVTFKDEVSTSTTYFGCLLGHRPRRGWLLGTSSSTTVSVDEQDVHIGRVIGRFVFVDVVTSSDSPSGDSSGTDVVDLETGRVTSIPGDAEAVVPSPYAAVAYTERADPPLTGTQPLDVTSGRPVIADVLGDARAETVEATSDSLHGTASWAVLPTTAAGTPAAPMFVAAPVPLTTVAVADVTGDGRPDLVGAGPGGVAVAVGPGFAHPVRSRTGLVGSAGLTVGRYDGDALPDLALRGVDGSLKIAHNLGGGRFRVAWSARVPGAQSDDALASADLDGDGRLDLALTINDRTVVVAHGGGDGTFTLGRVLPLPGSPVIADVDGDGKPDLVGLRPCGGFGCVVVAGNRGDGTFRPAHEVVRGPYEDVAVGDLDGDGHVDLVLAGVGVQGRAERVRLVRGTGRGAFARPGPWLLAAFGPPLTAVGDLTADGHPDLAVADGTRLSLLTNRGDGTLRANEPLHVLHLVDRRGNRTLGRGVIDGIAFRGRSLRWTQDGRRRTATVR